MKRNILWRLIIALLFGWIAVANSAMVSDYPTDSAPDYSDYTLTWDTTLKKATHQKTFEGVQQSKGIYYSGGNIAAVVTAIGSSTEAIIEVDVSETLGASLDISATKIQLKVTPGHVITVPNGITYTGNKRPIIAGKYQIFSITGTGAVSGLPESCPEWFGAKIDNTTDDTAAWQSALDSISSTGGVVHAPIGTSYCASPLVWPNDGTNAYSIRVIGNSPGPTAGAPASATGGVSAIRYDGNGNLFDLRNGDDSNLNWYGSLENLHLWGDSGSTGTAVYAYSIKWGTLKNLQIKHFHGKGINISNAIYYSTIENIAVMYCGDGFYAPAASFNGTTIRSSKFSDNDNEGIDISYAGYPVNIDGCWFEDNGSYGVKASYVAAININNSYFEANTTADVYISSSTFYNTEMNVIGSHFSAGSTHYSLYLDRVSKINIVGSDVQAYNSGTSRAIYLATGMTRGIMSGNNWPKVAGVTPVATAYFGNFLWNDSQAGLSQHGSTRLSYSTVIPKGSIVLNSDPENNGGQLGVVYTSPGAGSLATALSSVTADTTATSATLVVNSNASIPIGSAIEIVGATFGTSSAAYATVVSLTGTTGVTLDNVVNETLTGAAVSWHVASYKTLSGQIFDRSQTAVSTSGTGEDTLATVSIPAGYMNTTSGFHVVAAGTKTASNGNKTIKFYFGATAITFHAAANNTNDWRLDLWIWNLGASNSQGMTWAGWDGTTMLQGYDTAAIDTTSAVTMKITGECANAGDTITQTLWMVEAK